MAVSHEDSIWFAHTSARGAEIGEDAHHSSTWDPSSWRLGSPEGGLAHLLGADAAGASVGAGSRTPPRGFSVRPFGFLTVQ